MKNPLAPISWGELIDKITILEIKMERIASKEAIANVSMEYSILYGIYSEASFVDEVTKLKDELSTMNKTIWDIEDAIREKEKLKIFDREFIELARNVYKNNDKRANIKKNINALLGSELKEEKSYSHYL